MPRRVRLGQRRYFRLNSGLLCCSRENTSVTALKDCKTQGRINPAAAPGRELHAVKTQQVYTETTKNKQGNLRELAAEDCWPAQIALWWINLTFKCLVSFTMSVWVTVISFELNPDNTPIVKVPKLSFPEVGVGISPSGEIPHQANVGIALAFVPLRMTLTFAFSNESWQSWEVLLNVSTKKSLPAGSQRETVKGGAAWERRPLLQRNSV